MSGRTLGQALSSSISMAQLRRFAKTSMIVKRLSWTRPVSAKHPPCDQPTQIISVWGMMVLRRYVLTALLMSRTARSSQSARLTLTIR
jgi:hypothetical protein